jgi:hypothetical protein
MKLQIAPMHGELGNNEGPLALAICFMYLQERLWRPISPNSDYQPIIIELFVVIKMRCRGD